MPGLMGKDEARFHMIHFRTRGHRLQNKRPEMVRVADRHMEQEVVCAGHMKDLTHLGNSSHVLPELAHTTRFMFRQSDGDKRQEPDAERHRIHIGVKATDGSDLLQSPRSFQRG